MADHETLRQQMQALAARIRAAGEAGELPSHPGFPKPATPCDPECDVCQGKGWFLYDVHYGHPLFNKPQVCPNKPVDPAKAGLTQDEYENITWEDILPEGNAAEAVDAVMACIERGYGWVYLFGKPGKAKTLILTRAVKEGVERGLTAKYTDTKTMLDDLRSSFDDERKQTSLSNKLFILKNYRLLALDEFDRFNSTEWARAEVYDLMDSRYKGALRQESVTLMASNAPPATYEDYLKDRIYDGRFRVVHLIGDSLRPASDWEMP